MASVHDLEEMFPHFSRTLIEEVYRLKGSRTQSVLEMLCHEDDASSKSSTRTSFSNGHSAFSLSSRRGVLMGMTVTESDTIKEKGDSGCEGDGVSEPYVLVKAASTRSGWPDVVLGEELYEVLSCPGGYERCTLNAYDLEEDDDERSYCLDDLFRMPIEEEDGDCKNYMSKCERSVDVSWETGASLASEKESAVECPARDDPLLCAEGRSRLVERRNGDWVDAQMQSGWIDAADHRGVKDGHLSEDVVQSDSQHTDTDLIQIPRYRLHGHLENSAPQEYPQSVGGGIPMRRREALSMVTPGTPASPGTPDALEAETAECIAWFDEEKPPPSKPSSSHLNHTVNSLSTSTSGGNKDPDAAVQPIDDADDDYITFLMMSSVRCNDRPGSSEDTTEGEPTGISFALPPIFTSEDMSEICPDNIPMTSSSPNNKEISKNKRNVGVKSTAADDVEEGDNGVTVGVVTSPSASQSDGCSVHASVYALCAASMLRSHLQLLSVGIHDFKSVKSKERDCMVKDIRMRINQVSWSQRQVASISDCIMEKLRNCRATDRKLFILDQISEQIIKSLQGRTNEAYAISLACVARHIMDSYPEFHKILLGHLQHANPLLVPMYWLPNKNTEATVAEYRRYMQYQPDESEDAHLQRQTGVVHFHAALIAVDSHPLETLPSIRKWKNLYSIESGWTYLARYVNTIPPDRTTVRFLHIFLKIAGNALLMKYGRQFLKVLSVIERGFVFEGRSLEDAQADVSRLKTLLEKSDYNHIPKAFKMPRSEESRNIRC